MAIHEISCWKERIGYCKGKVTPENRTSLYKAMIPWGMWRWPWSAHQIVALSPRGSSFISRVTERQFVTSQLWNMRAVLGLLETNSVSICWTKPKLKQWVQTKKKRWRHVRVWVICGLLTAGTGWGVPTRVLNIIHVLHSVRHEKRIVKQTKQIVVCTYIVAVWHTGWRLWRHVNLGTLQFHSVKIGPKWPKFP